VCHQQKAPAPEDRLDPISFNDIRKNVPSNWVIENQGLTQRGSNIFSTKSRKSAMSRFAKPANKSVLQVVGYALRPRNVFSGRLIYVDSDGSPGSGVMG
jgi:hypothetical protein